MGMQFSIKMTDLRPDVQAAEAQAIATALTACGLQAEGYAKLLCPVDTGNLRNSITNALDGSGKTVYVGTNVEYAPYVEYGTYRTRAQPYLKPAFEEHVSEYKSIIETYLVKLGGKSADNS